MNSSDNLKGDVNFGTQKENQLHLTFQTDYSIFGKTVNNLCYLAMIHLKRKAELGYEYENELSYHYETEVVLLIKSCFKKGFFIGQSTLWIHLGLTKKTCQYTLLNGNMKHPLIGIVCTLGEKALVDNLIRTFCSIQAPASSTLNCHKLNAYLVLP